MAIICVRVDENVKEVLRQIADSKGVELSELVREMIAKGIISEVAEPEEVLKAIVRAVGGD
mgnify:CR=1 FL=1